MDFLAVEDVVSGRQRGRPNMLTCSSATRQRRALFFKVWQLSPYLKYLVAFGWLCTGGR